MSETFDPLLVEKAKRVAAGHLGQQMAKFPLRFAKAAVFGRRPFRDSLPDVRNGTVALIDFGRGPIAITCSHVLEGYREWLKKDGEAMFQIGNLEINPLENIIDEDEKLDLATIKLDQAGLQKIVGREEIGSSSFRPVSWPPKDVKEGEYILFGGYPGLWKSHFSGTEIVFDSFSSGASAVTSVGPDYMICQFEREYWTYGFNLRNPEDLHDLGGLSGSPVFILRDLHFEFVGIVYQFSQKFDLMYIRPSKFVREDGTISES